MVAERTHGGSQGGVAGIAITTLEFSEEGAAAFDASKESGKGVRRGGSVLRVAGHQ